MWVFFFLLQQFLMSNKLETAMWLSRLFTVYCSVMFILPILGWVHSVTLFYQVWPTATRCFHPLILSPRLNRCQNIFPACVFQTLCSSKLLSESLVSERPHQCPSPSSKAATLSVEQSVPGPGSSGGQLPLPAVLTHPGQLLPHHKYPFSFKPRRKRDG